MEFKAQKSGASELSYYREIFQREGYLVVRSLFRPEECDDLTEYYMRLRETERPMDYAGVDPTSEDPLKRYPRMIHMHRWDEKSLQWLTDARLNSVLTALCGAEPLAVQTMLYFKPPGARGQALHQDNSYLRVEPSTCLAAWLALDDCDEANGCMQVVPGTHDLPILCTEKADTSQSFTDVTVPLPPGTQPMPIVMQRGDVLFFNGSLIHGSFPNTTEDRFRRALIGHYVAGDADKVGAWYHPVYTMQGEIVEFGVSEPGAPCGRYVEKDGTPALEMVPPADHDRVARHE